MTSEIAVLNRFGLAIAADSAVTVDQFHENEIITKTYNSANKLFMLSKHAPVAVMFYNTVMVASVPWETIVKAYRKTLGTTTFSTLEEYCSHFFAFIDGNDLIFPQDRVSTATCVFVFRELRTLAGKAKNKAEFRALLEKSKTAVEKLERLDCFSLEDDAMLFTEYKDKLDEWIGLAVPVSYLSGNKKLIYGLLKQMIVRKRMSNAYSGIVIAGFGEQDYLPKLRHFVCDGIVDGKMRRWLKSSVDISDSVTGMVVPLADSEVSETLVSGINPRFKKKAYDEAFKIMMGMPQVIVTNIASLSDPEKKVAIESGRYAMFEAFKEFYKGIEKLREQDYESPINSTISSLPVAELGAVAETFINASHIHKRVNPGFETVGGPVDVAVISKGDGFVWAKRKHYFDAKLNPTFALSYLDK